MIEPRPGDQARATVLVAVPPDVAFQVFTEEIDQWWRRGLKYRVAGISENVLRLFKNQNATQVAELRADVAARRAGEAAASTA